MPANNNCGGFFAGWAPTTPLLNHLLGRWSAGGTVTPSTMTVSTKLPHGGINYLFDPTAQNHLE